MDDLSTSNFRTFTISPVRKLSPCLVAELNLLVGKHVDVVVQGEDALGLDLGVRVEPV